LFNKELQVNLKLESTKNLSETTILLEYSVLK